MTGHSLFYYPYASFTDAELPKVAALWFDNLFILDPLGGSWDSVGADHIALDAARQLKDAGILEIVTPTAVLAKYELPVADAIRRDMTDRESLDLCNAQTQAIGKQCWTRLLAKVPQDLQTDQRPAPPGGRLHAGDREGFRPVAQGRRWRVEYCSADLPRALGYGRWATQPY